jgi:outer membrane protein assembly factor BamA
MDIGGKQVEVNPRFRITAFNIGGPGSELRTDIGIGTELYFLSELYQPFHTPNSFIAPYLKFDQAKLSKYDDSYLINSYKYDRCEIGLDVGYLFGKSAELRVGYVLGNQGLRQESGQKAPLDLDGVIRKTRLKWSFNNTDQMIFAKDGFDWKLEANWYDSAPGGTPFSQAETQLIKCFPIGAKDMIFNMFAAGDTFEGTPPWAQQFHLGGPFHLGSHNINELSGNNYLLLNIGYLKSLGEFPLTAKNIYLGLWLEDGGIFDNWSDLELTSDISIGLLSTTIFGQIYAGISYGEGNNRAVNIMLGHFF